MSAATLLILIMDQRGNLLIFMCVLQGGLKTENDCCEQARSNM